jgi:hypothetical protein
MEYWLISLREYINRMLYHTFSSDPESVVPEWTFKVSGPPFTTAFCRELRIDPTPGIS